MDFKFSVDELVVVVSALRQEYRHACEYATVARRKQSTASSAEASRDFLNMAKWYDERCSKCADVYRKIIDKNILEDL